MLQQALSSDHSNPLAEVNTTPLIDVLLVLLVMFIITIPLQTHAVKIDLPTACLDCPTPDDEVNTITIDAADQIAWNHEPINMSELRSMLIRTQQMRSTPELHLLPDASARYSRVDEVLAAIKRANVKKFGFVGTEAHRNIF